jgi:uncharacterized membrane protein YGL010W
VSLWRRFVASLDVRAGLIGATLMAAVVFWINAEHGALGASTAAAKQWVYTFFMGAWIVQLCGWLARRPGGAVPVVGLAVVLPTLVTIGATFLVHSARGTPRPVASTVPVAVISPPSFLGWALRTRRAARAGRGPWERLSKGEGA